MEKETCPKSELKSRKAYRGEVESTEKYIQEARMSGITIETLIRDSGLETVNRLRGPHLHLALFNTLSELGQKANIIQIEVVNEFLKNSVHRKELVKLLAKFSAAYEQYLAISIEQRANFIDFLREQKMIQ